MRNLPLIIINIYIIGTLLISFFGPLKYLNYDRFSVVIYIFLFLTCLNIGFLFRHKINIVVNKPIKNSNTNIDNLFMNKKVIKLINISIYIGLMSITLEFIDTIVKNPSLLSLNQLGNNYMSIREELAGENGYSLALIVRFLTGFFRNVVLILAPYYFKQLSKSHKLLFFIYLLFLIMVNGIAYGTQKFLGDILIFLLIIWFIKMLDMSMVKRMKILKNSAILMVLFVIVFSYMQVQRYDVIGVTATNFAEHSTGDSYYDTDHIIFDVFGDRLGFGIATMMSAYMSGGYYGLSLALQLPFEWTYGFGNSYIASEILDRLHVVENLYEQTYLNRMLEEFGRDGLRTWNTIFPWLASDLTFLGALLIFIPIGYVFGVTWYEILRYRNPASILLFSILFLGFIFVPANNQLFNSIDTYISTVCIIIYWLFNHKKYNFTPENL
ncbi:hypothetical protein [Cytobacillus firmus]|uniref:hypothetical protein n=1 Tax=Cytobacillus firmus TaxID=1399 RepID=UPI001C8DB042|nr:hypothetical protein [Cytobacillus firmus]MBX9974445.1 hypothetical protein [Cytobacillus firmus]